MAVARYFGWAAVAGPHAMDWPTYQLARQYLAEELVGSKIREIEAQERREAAQSARHLRETRR